MSEPVTDPAAAATLHRLLADGTRWDCEYRGGLSNHLPMALLALQRLGAGAARLEAFASGYAPRLEAAPPEASWPSGDAWPGRFGERAAWPAYRALFAEWIGHEGAADVLQQTLPVLMPGCGAAAFHGLIRTAYAVQSGAVAEVADGLAYWSCRYLPLGAQGEARAAETDPEPALRRLRAGRSRRSLIFQRMADAALDPALHEAVASVAIDDGSPERLARLAARAYALSGDFTALHLVTSAHAMRVLARFFEPEWRATGWRWYWQAFAAAVVAAGMRANAAPALRPWSQIVEAAIESSDDHLIKLVYSCREEERAYGGSDWHLAASRALA